jgi:hypothetical protein
MKLEFHLFACNLFYVLDAWLRFEHAGPARYVLRDRPPSTAACPGCWAIGTRNSVQKIFCTWPTRAAKGEQKYLVPARQTP